MCSTGVLSGKPVRAPVTAPIHIVGGTGTVPINSVGGTGTVAGPLVPAFGNAGTNGCGANG